MRERAARVQLERILTGLESYQIDVGEFPTTDQGLRVLLRDPGARGWSGPYMPKEIPLDPWCRPYKYVRREDGAAEVMSLGAEADGSKAIAATKRPWIIENNLR